ncbi:MAG: nucleotidyltransferase family protein [Acidimicrobiales bacterium]
MTDTGGAAGANSQSDELLPRLRVWPEPWQEDLIRAVVAHSDDDAVAAWRRVRARHSLRELQGSSSRLLSMIGRRLARLAPDDEDVATLRTLHRATWAANVRMLGVTLPHVMALADAGMEPLVLKGAVLLEAYHGDLGARSSVDVDILVRRRDFMRALDLLAARGLDTDEDTAMLLRMGHGVGVTDGAASLDVHHLMSSWLDLDEDGLWSHSETISILGNQVHVPSPTDLLTHVVVHGIRPAWPVNLRWIVDALAILRERGGDVDWDRLVAGLDGPAIPLVDAGLSYLAETFDAPVPGAVFDGLAARHVGLRARLLYRVSMTSYLGPTFGNVPGLVSHFARTRRGQGTRALPGDLSEFLTMMLGVERLGELPGVVRARWRRHRRRLKSGGRPSATGG